MPDFPSIHAAAALLLTLVTFVLFAMGRLRIELICLGLIAVLALGFYFFPFVQEGRFTSMEVAFGGFSHEALVAICCLMILGRGLLITGALLRPRWAHSSVERSVELRDFYATGVKAPDFSVAAQSRGCWSD
jgi:hypothetical protein